MNDITNWLPGVLSNIFDDHDVQLELGRRLAHIDPRIRWEAGPYGDVDLFFAFSLNFCDDLLPVTETLAMTMPAIEGWQFLGAKPKKRWLARKLIFRGDEYLFDDWRYRLVSFNSGEFFDVEFFTFDGGIAEQACADLGTFLASSELGEKLFMRAIDRVSVSTHPRAGEATIHIDYLYQQIVELLQGEVLSE
jgi:hypothetical protein